MSDLRERIANLPPEKRALLEKRLRQKQANASPAPPVIQPTTEAGLHPLSFAQEQLWFLDQLYPNESLYNETLLFRLTGALDVAVLQAALNAVVARHDILRTTYSAENGQPHQIVQPTATLPLTLHDLRHLPSAEIPNASRAFATNFARQPFDLGRDLPLRAALIQQTDDTHWLLLVEHHIATDAWSSAVLLRDIATAYRQKQGNQPVSLPPLPIQYVDVAHWQRSQSEQTSVTDLAYWRQQLDGLKPLELPTRQTRPAQPTHRGESITFALDEALGRDLAALARGEQATLTMLLLAAFNVLLARYSNQSDIAVGMPAANRPTPETEALIGFFVNMLVVRSDLSAEPSFRDLLRRVRATVGEALQHQTLPYEKLVAELQPERQVGRNPLFQVVFQVNNGPPMTFDLPNVACDPLAFDHGSAKFDLDVAFYQQDGVWHGRWLFSKDILDRDSAERMVGHFVQLLRGIVANPDQSIHTLPLLTPAEWSQIEAWNHSAETYPRQSTIHALFEQQAAATPDALALYFEGKTLTYRQLDQRANQLAHALVARGVAAGEMVGMALERSLEMVVAMVAILKAGAAYLPLDADYPAERLQFMLADGECRLTITHAAAADRLPLPAAQRLPLDDAPTSAEIAAQPTDYAPTVTGVSAEGLAYAMFTSGSTGRPKGTLIPHRAVVRLVKHTTFADLGPQQRFLQFAPVSFDAATLEIWGPLLNGGQLYIYKPGLDSLAALGRYLTTHAISFVWLTSGLFHQMVDHEVEALSQVAQVFSGGDVVSPTHVRRLLDAGGVARFTNGYGPTENTTFTTTHTVTNSAEIGDKLPIGKPIAHSQALILDAHLQPVPIGVPGELFAGGDGLAIGYLKRPALTAEKFIPSPFSDDPTVRLYRTGDLARYLPDGSIDFLGRLDSQVKIRGFRIELGEIETALTRHPAVKRAVVVVDKDASAEKRLLAYAVVGRKATTVGDDTAPNEAELLAFLRDRLPDYMLPAHLLILPELPLNPNGKIDRRALPKPTSVASPQANVAQPRTATEEALAALWCDLLQVDSVDIHTDFFAAGGHSLLGVRLFAQIAERFDKDLPLTLLFQAPTIAQLAEAISAESEDCDPVLVPIHPVTDSTCTPFFFVHGVFGDTLAFINLAPFMPPDQPVYGLQAIGLQPDAQPDKTIEAMAARYIAAIRRVQPEGPYQLGGFCFGGVVAFEMARQMKAAGEHVALLAIIEGSAPRRFHKPPPLWQPQRLALVWQSAPYWLRGYREFGGYHWKRWLKRRLGRDRAQQPSSHPTKTPSATEFDNLADFNAARPANQLALRRVNIGALRDYRPEPYEGDVTFFRARCLRIGHAFRAPIDPQRGWGTLSLGRVQMQFVDGTHSGILTQPYVQDLGTRLADALADAHRS